MISLLPSADWEHDFCLLFSVNEFLSSLELAASSRMDGCFLCPGYLMGFPGKESTYTAGDLALIPRLGRSPGEGNGHMSSCLFNIYCSSCELIVFTRSGFSMFGHASPTFRITPEPQHLFSKYLLNG